MRRIFNNGDASLTKVGFRSRTQLRGSYRCLHRQEKANLREEVLENWSASSYAFLLGECATRRWVQGGRWVHSHMVRTGFPYLKLSIKLIDMYLKCGRIDDARKLFNKMPPQHVVPWNAMISAYAQHGCGKEALRLFMIMHFGHVFPDEFTFTSVFKACADLGYALGGRVAHGRMVVSGLKANVFVGSAIIDMYVKCSRVKDARLVFDGMDERDVVLWTALVVGYVHNEKDEEALEMFGEMVHGGMRPDEYTVASVLIACGNLLALREGIQIHAVIIKEALELDNSSHTSLLSMYAKCGSVGDSFKVFNGMSNANMVSWTAMITGLVQNGQEEDALSLFHKMTSFSIKPNQFTFSVALKACAGVALFAEGKQIHVLIMKAGFDTDVFVAAALIDMYGKCGCMGMALLVFNNRLLEKDVVLFNAMISGYAQNGHGQEGLQLFEEMQQLGIIPNSATFISLLSACSNSGMLEEGRRVFRVMFALGIVLSREHYGCMVDLLGRAGQLEEAEKLIRSMPMGPDTVIWRTLLSACKIHGEIGIGQRAAESVLRLVEEDDGTHVLLSNLYASASNWTEVARIKNKMRNIGVKKDPALSWIEVNHKIYVFVAGDQSHPRKNEIYAKLDELILRTEDLGYVPDTRFVLQDLDDEMKERSLHYHSEKLTIAFGLLCLPLGVPIRIFKNLRVCGDCHNWIKFTSRVVQREIIARDAKRFHHFKDGICSCGDYW
ncbi:pentatricopeptide repeat-containing protein At5g65570 isoform X1 [Nymphaea colorata]|nr:pentatricopeptide repeat-containing protein At5g65570 isoform X1 [Nymphaea colorata]